MPLGDAHAGDGTRSEDPDVWFQRFRPRKQSAFALYCLPYAGGSASAIFRPWAAGLGADVDLRAVMLPGRGARIAEPASTDVGDLATRIASAIAADDTQGGFGLLGHSFGAVLAFEVARRIEASRAFGIRQPKLVVVSGREAPVVALDEPKLSTLGRDGFWQALETRYGVRTPSDVAANAELMVRFRETTFADVVANDGYQYETSAPLACDLVALAGLRDDAVPRYAVEAWRTMTEGAFSSHVFPGAHYFIETDGSFVMRRLRRILRRYVGAAGSALRGPSRGAARGAAGRVRLEAR